MKKEIEIIINEIKEIEPISKNVERFLNSFTNKGNLYKYIRFNSLLPNTTSGPILKFWTKNKDDIFKGIAYADDFNKLILKKPYGLGDVTSLLQNYYRTPHIINGHDENEKRSILISREKVKNTYLNKWINEEKYMFLKKSINGNYDISTNKKISEEQRDIALFEEKKNIYTFLGYFNCIGEKYDSFILKKSSLKYDHKHESIISSNEIYEVVNEELLTVEKELNNVNEQLIEKQIEKSNLVKNQEWQNNEDYENLSSLFYEEWKNKTIEKTLNFEIKHSENDNLIKNNKNNNNNNNDLLYGIVFEANRRFLKLKRTSENFNCDLTGIKKPELLEIYYIKPWSESNSEEKINSNNSLLLNKYHGKLFKNGLITFNSISGEIIFSSLIPKQIIEENMKYKIVIFNEEMSEFLEYNKKFVFKP